MIREGEDELICDFAEVYHIDWTRRREYSLVYLATLAMGLRENSRIYMKLSGRDYDMQKQLNGYMVDLLQYLVWFQTKDGHKNRNRPKPVLKGNMKSSANPEHLSFSNAEEFEHKMKEIKLGDCNSNSICNNCSGN